MSQQLGNHEGYNHIVIDPGEFNPNTDTWGGLWCIYCAQVIESQQLLDPQAVINLFGNHNRVFHTKGLTAPVKIVVDRKEN